ncbi:MAG: hypothetical protein C4326_12340 [Ignavibacteria bacterium]
MRTYKTHPIDSASLPSNAIWSLCEDTSAHLWIGAYTGGVSRMDLKSEKITRLGSSPLIPATLNAVPIKALYVDRKNVLWIGSFGAGLGMLDLSTNAARVFTHDPSNAESLCDNTIFSLLEDRSGILWVGTANGLCAFDSSRRRWTRFVHDPAHPRSLSNNIVVTVFEDHRGRLWVGTKNGLNLLDRATGTFTRFDTASAPRLSGASIYGIGIHCVGADTTVWFATRSDGLNRYDERTHTFTVFKNVIGDPTSLSDDNINCLFTDRTGTLWIGTLQGGVSKINTERKKVRSWRNDPSNSNSLPKGGVYALTQDSSGNFWIGTFAGGACRFDPRTETFTHMNRHTNHGLGDDDVTAFHTGPTGTVWLGTFRGYLGRFDPAQQRFVPFSHVSSHLQRLANVIIDGLHEDRKGRLWIGTVDHGLKMFDPRANVLVQYLPDSSNPQSLSHGRVTAIWEGRDGTFWIGTEGGGLNRFDPTTRSFTHFRSRSNDTTSLSGDLVYAVLEDHRGMLWVGTANGLNRYDPATRSFQRVQNDLASDYIKGLLEDQRQNLWVMTANSIAWLSPDRTSVVRFDHHDGFVNFVFNDAYLLARSGHVYAGGSHGVDIFHPDSLVEQTRVPPVVLTDFTVYNNPYTLPQAMPFVREIGSLAWNQNFFSISFAVLDYDRPQRNRFAYTMTKEGDPQWISSGTSRFANFTNIDPGTYLFTAMGANSNGIWNREGATLRISITPPFWKTPWFAALALAAIIGILAAIYNYRIGQLLKIERLRLRIAGDLHDDVGSSLSAIALITEMVGRSLPSSSIERERLAAAAQVAHTTADSLRDIVWLINPEHETVEDMLLRMKDAASKLLAHMHYTFETDGIQASRVLDMEQRRNIILIYKELLNNIAKHAQATKVEITVRQADGVFVLNVRDNGRGFDEASITRGHGLNNVRRRAEQIGGTVTIASTPGQGTTAEVRFKIP